MNKTWLSSKQHSSDRYSGSTQPDGQFNAGQAIIEFALALPLLILLILGALEFGRAFQTKIVVENAAREGVHYYIYDQDDQDFVFVNTKSAVIADAANSGVEIPDSKIEITCFVDANNNGVIDAGEAGTCDGGSTIDITVTVDFELAVIGSFTNPLPISSNARMVVP